MKYVFETGSFAVAMIAIYISYRTYLRQKTFENENHLFKYKLEKYHEVLDILNELFQFVEKKITEYNLALYDVPVNKAVLETIDDELEDELGSVEMKIFANSAFLPEVIFKEIEKLMDKLFEANFLEKYEKGDYIKQLEKLGNAEDLIFDIGEVMREDLGINPLNTKLHSRTHEWAQKKSV